MHLTQLDIIDNFVNRKRIMVCNKRCHALAIKIASRVPNNKVLNRPGSHEITIGIF